jgi:hypothetical protein
MGKEEDDEKNDAVESSGEAGGFQGYPTLAISFTAAGSNEGMNSGAVDEREVLASWATPLGTN